MNLGQTITTVEYKITFADESYDLTLERHLNEIGKQGWFLHSFTEHQTDMNDYVQNTYRCIWQRITQNVSGLIT